MRDNETEVTLGESEIAAKERWDKYKSDNALKASRYETDVDAGVTRDKNEMADKLARWKHENRTIEMSVEPGKVIVLDPVSGKKLGLKPVESGEYQGTVHPRWRQEAGRRNSYGGQGRCLLGSGNG